MEGIPSKLSKLIREEFHIKRMAAGASDQDAKSDCRLEHPEPVRKWKLPAMH